MARDGDRVEENMGTGHLLHPFLCPLTGMRVPAGSWGSGQSQGHCVRLCRCTVYNTPGGEAPQADAARVPNNRKDTVLALEKRH